VTVYERLMTFLRCPTCRRLLELETLADTQTAYGREISEGLLHCELNHWFPITGGIPRMLPDSFEEHRQALARHVRDGASPVSEAVAERLTRVREVTATYDQQTRENFSLEWDQHDIGSTTWGMELDDRVRWFFLEPIRIDADDLAGKVMLDAGCGNGSQSVAYTRFGLDVVAMDLSSGIEHGHRLRHVLRGARPDLVHFVQGDLQAPPLASAQFDLIHSAGVLHHTPDTEATFRGLTPMLRPGGAFYVWLYKYEPLVTPVVNSIRAISTRVPPAWFARVAGWSAGAFQLFCRATNALGIRSYTPLSRREATLALMDIFGAPHAHYHSFEEVERWYRSEGFDQVWRCCDGRRGFGACGRRAVQPVEVDDTSTRVGASNGRSNVVDVLPLEAP